jgi:hypothetical protein
MEAVGDVATLFSASFGIIRETTCRRFSETTIIFGWFFGI